MHDHRSHLTRHPDRWGRIGRRPSTVTELRRTERAGE